MFNKSCRWFCYPLKYKNHSSQVRATDENLMATQGLWFTSSESWSPLWLMFTQYSQAPWIRPHSGPFWRFQLVSWDGLGLLVQSSWSIISFIEPKLQETQVWSCETPKHSLDLACSPKLVDNSCCDRLHAADHPAQGWPLARQQLLWMLRAAVYPLLSLASAFEMFSISQSSQGLPTGPVPLF